MAGQPSFEAELYFLIARYLSNGPCKAATQALIEEVGKYELLPKRLDWLGNEHPRTYEDLARSCPHISPNHLLKICSRLGPMLDREVLPNVSGVNSLLAGGRQSLLRTKDDLIKSAVAPTTLTARLHGQPLMAPINLLRHPNITQLLITREQSGPIPTHQMIPTKFYRSMQMCCRRLGHLSSVYCLLFDRTGRYIFTGADDLLVKVWNASDGRLIAAFRGHSAEITDMAVNYENTLLAAGSCDKIIRVWCLRTASPLAVLTGHTAMITSLKFCPCPRGVDRFLVSTGNDGCIYFWSWNVDTSNFNPQPRRFTERNRPGAQMQCSSFSPGGIFVATGSTDHHVRIYNVYGSNGPERILELEAHTDRVDSIQFANHSERFVSGSRDGTANIWRFEKQNWRRIPLRMSTRKAGEPVQEIDDTKITKLKVTMVGWDSDDRYVITAVNDFSIKVWNANNGELVYQLEGHEDEVFVLESNPVDPRIFLSAGHDGRIILWDLTNGTVIKNYFNVIEGQGHGAVFDCKFSPDGRSFAFTDSHGHICIFGFGSNEKYRKIPDELFFHTDYRPLIRDANHHVLDEQTQQAPHVMPPPFLVNIDGNPYPPELQRLVPGRENCNTSQLVPHVVAPAAGGTGQVEVLEVVRPPDNNNNNNGEEQQPPALIDALIGRLQREGRSSTAGGAGTSGAGPSQSPMDEFPPPLPSGSALGPLSPRPVSRLVGTNQVNSPSHGRVGMRRSGDVEGVRQSQGNWQSRVQPSQGELLAWSRRVMVADSDPGALRHLEERRLRLSDAELQHFRREKKRRPEPPPSQHHHTANDKKGKSRGGRKESKKRLCRTRTVRAQSQRGAYNGSDFEHPDNMDLSSSAHSETDEKQPSHSSSSSSSNSDSEYSDWTQDVGVNLQPPKRHQAVTKPKSSSRYSRRLASLMSEDDDEDYDDNDRNKAEGSSRDDKLRSSSSRIKAKAQAKDARRVDLLQIAEVAPDFRPSEWLTETVPHKTPYYPQMGDEIIYFRQGHKCYTDAVKRSKKFKILERNQPWRKINLRDQELVKVVGIRYEIHPPRLCCLKLSAIDPDTGLLLDQTFTIKYHDMPDVIDFLVLRQTYDLAMSRNWKEGDRFRSMIDNAWWVGTIASQEPFQPEFPDSMFQCFNVAWDNGEREKMSPWDLEPLDENRMPPEVGGSTAVLGAELTALLYRPSDSEWTSVGLEAECDRILSGLEQIMGLSCAEPFITPVDLSLYPSYAYIVEYPIDLAIIRARLQNRFYRRITSVQFDVRFIETNAKKFNEQGSRIVKQAHILTELCLRLVGDTSCVDVMPLYQEIAGTVAIAEGFQSDTTSSSDSDDSSEEEETMRRGRSSTKTEQRRKKSKRDVETFNSSSWKQHCKDFVNVIIQCEDSEPFRTPVDPALYPDYQSIIDHPMDFSTIREKLSADSYPTPVDFCRDCRLVFMNSRNYNINKKSRIYSMTIRMSAMFEEQIRIIISDWKSAVKYEQKVQNNHFVSDRRRPLPPQGITELVPSTSRGSASGSRGQPSSRPNSREDVPYRPSGGSSRRTHHRRSQPAPKRQRLGGGEQLSARPHDNGRATTNGRRVPPSKTKRTIGLSNGHEGSRRTVPSRTKTRPRRFLDSDEDGGRREQDDDDEEDDGDSEPTPRRPARRPPPRGAAAASSKRVPPTPAIQRNGRRRKEVDSENAVDPVGEDSRSSSPGALVVDEDGSNDSTSKSRTAVSSKSGEQAGSGSDSSSSSSSNSSSSSSSSDTDDGNGGGGGAGMQAAADEGNTSDHVRRSTRTSTQNSTRATRSAAHERSPRPSSARRPTSVTKRKRSDSDEAPDDDDDDEEDEDDDGGSSEDSDQADKRRSRRIATRKRTKPVRYREDSEFEYDFNSEDSDAGPGVIKLVRHTKRGGGGGSGGGGGGGGGSSNRRRSTALGRGFIKS